MKLWWAGRGPGLAPARRVRPGLRALAVAWALPVAWTAAWAACQALATGSAAADPAAATPQRVLWAWSRSDDMSFLARPDMRGIGVAYLSGEILLRRDGLRVQPRVRPLRLPRDVERTAVIYLEVSRAFRRVLDDDDVRRLAARVRRLPLVRDADRVQLNFEAVQSRRPLWDALVAELRRQMPPAQALDVAVLADWCMDPAFAPAGVDRVVPMLYRLGPLSPALSRVLDGAAPFPAAACRVAVGIATDEPHVVAPRVLAPARIVYIFSPGAWTAAGLREAEAALVAEPSIGPAGEAAGQPAGEASSQRPLRR